MRAFQHWITDPSPPTNIPFHLDDGANDHLVQDASCFLWSEPVHVTVTQANDSPALTHRVGIILVCGCPGLPSVYPMYQAYLLPETLHKTYSSQVFKSYHDSCPATPEALANLDYADHNGRTFHIPHIASLSKALLHDFIDVEIVRLTSGPLHGRLD